MPSCSRVRWGEKVPAAVGTVADRLAVGDLLSAGEVEGAVLAPHPAGPATGGARLLLAEGLGLLLQEGGQGAFGEPGRGGGRDLLQGREIDVQSRPLVAEGPSGDDFAPLGGESTDILEVLRREGVACHRPSCLQVAETGRVLLSFLLYGKRICQAKQVLTS